MLKIHSIDSLCLREKTKTKKPPPFFKTIFESLQKQTFCSLHPGSQWIALAVSTSQTLHIWVMPHNPHPKVRQTRDVLERLLLDSLPPGNWGKTGTFACQGMSMESRAEQIPQYRYNSILSCTIMVAPYLVCSVKVYLVNIYYIWVLKIRKLFGAV